MPTFVIHRAARIAAGAVAATMMVACARAPRPDDPTVTGGRSRSPVGAPPAPRFNPPAGRIDLLPVPCAGVADAGAITFEKVAAWRDDADAAYAMVHDDVCGFEMRGIDQIALPALEMRNLTATLGPFVKACEEERLWDMVRAAQARGHEIANHSNTHTAVRAENAQFEIADAKRMLDAQLVQPVQVYLFPFDDFSEPSALDAVVAAGHLAARAGNRDDNDGFDAPPINLRDGRNDLTLEFDAWPRSHSKYTSFAPADLLNVHVFDAIERQGFAVREFHSVTPREVAPLTGEGFGPVPLRTYERHLDFLVNAWKANKVWTSTVGTIIRYRRARQACGAAIQNDTITYTADAPDCRTFATPLSVVLKTTKDVPGLAAVQGGVPVFVRKLGPSRFSVTADPTAGPVEVAGCSTAVAGVDATVVLPAKPAPAASVCDLETVVGGGNPGRMDDLERSPADLQILPNPGQSDGRYGSWSWHPAGKTHAQIVPEGRGRILSFSNAQADVWAGVTLAFLGANGSGTCYDGRAYQGVRFKAKAQVAPAAVGPDAAAAGRVFVSLITAATASRKFGGDLIGEGGHFATTITVTGDWTVVSLPFAGFAPPGWGDTRNLTTLALDRLQAIDWGTNAGSGVVQLSLDDVELY